MNSTKIAVITDTHGNLPALKAALTAIQGEHCDAIYHLGDAIGIGPSPAECADLIFDTPNLTCILGNHEQYYLQGILPKKLTPMSTGETQQHKWIHQQLGEHRKSQISKWKQIIDRDIQGVKVRFQHYGFSNNGQSYARIIREPKISDLDQIFDGIEANVVFFGHAHEATDITGERHYVNPGSLGCNRKAVAKYTVAEFQNGKMNCFHREIPYDDTELFTVFEKRNMPNRNIVYALCEID